MLERTGSNDLYIILRQCHFRWAGHVHQIDDIRLRKTVLYGELANAPCQQGHPPPLFQERPQKET